MKNLFTLLLFSLISINLFSQINIGKSKSPINLYVSDHDEKDFDYIKNTTTYFIVPDSLGFKDVKNTIGNIWTFNSLIFISQEEFEKDEYKYIQGGNSIIRLKDDLYHKVKDGVRTVAEYITFRFTYNTYIKVEKTKKNKIKKEVLNVAEIFFTSNIKLRSDVIAASSRQSLLMPGKLLGKKKKIDKTDEKPGFYNFDLGYIKNYFQELNSKLLKGENLKIRDGIVNKDKLKQLKNKTLFAPNWLLKKYNAMQGDLKEIITPDELFAKYSNQYKVIPNEELTSKILNGDDFYYLMHTQYNQTKIISIIHSLTGEIIYLSEDSSYNLKDSDFKTLSKLIN
jgi:hypothetical protein